MGQQLGKDGEKSKEAFNAKYFLLEDKDDPHYGNIKIYERNDEEKLVASSKQEERAYMRAQTLAAKESTFQDVDTIDQQLKKMRQLTAATAANYTNNTTTNIIDVYECFVQSEDKFCSSVQRLQIILEYLQRDLQIEIKTKKLQNQRFTPQEIFTIAFSCINSIANMQSSNIVYGDLKTSKILVSEFFEIKLLHPFINKSIPLHASLIAKLNTAEKSDISGIYLSPLLTKAVATHQYTPSHNPFKSDVFSLGIIMIECCNLGAVDNVFDYLQGEIREAQLKQYLLMIKNQYGTDIHDLIARMVNLKEEERPDFFELSIELKVSNKMNELHVQQQQLIEQQINLKQNRSEQIGVSLYRAMNTEAEEEYNYSKPAQLTSSFVGNQNSTNLIGSRYQPPQSNQSQQNLEQSNIVQQLPISGQQSDHFQQSNFSFQKKNSFHQQQQQQAPAPAFSPFQPFQNQSVNSNKNSQISDPKTSAQFGQTSKETLQPNSNFPTINNSMGMGITMVRSSAIPTHINPMNSSSSTASFPTNQQSSLNVQGQSYNYQPNNQNQQIPNAQTSNQSFRFSNSNNFYQSGIYNPSPPLQQPNQQILNQAQFHVNGPQMPNQQHPQLGFSQNPPPQFLPPQQFNPPQNNIPFQPPQNRNSTQIGQAQQGLTGSRVQIGDNFNAASKSSTVISQGKQGEIEISENIQKIMQQIKEKQIESDLMYLEKERASQSELKRKIIQKSLESPQPSLNRISSQSNLTPSPLSSKNNVQVEQNKQLDLVLSQQLPFSQYQQLQQDKLPTASFNRIGQPAKEFSQHNLHQNSPNDSNSSSQKMNMSQQQQQQQRQLSQQSQHSFQQNQPFLQQLDQNKQNSSHPSLSGTQSKNEQQQSDRNSEGLLFSRASSQQRVPTEAFSTNRYEHIHETYDDQSYYIGEKLGGLRHGSGKFYYADGGYYEGEWKEGRMEGLGTLYYPSGSLAYLGQWRNDQFNGKGTVYNESPSPIVGEFDYKDFDKLGEFWVKYEGDFCEDNKEGIGTIYLSNGDKFTGSFNNDFVHGQGAYIRQNIQPIQGMWDCNHMVQYL